jgi:hypothetical protein
MMCRMLLLRDRLGGLGDGWLGAWCLHVVGLEDGIWV